MIAPSRTSVDEIGKTNLPGCGTSKGSSIAAAEGGVIVRIEVAEFEPGVTEGDEKLQDGEGDGPVTVQAS